MINTMKVPKYIQEILEILNQQGYQAYIVGGAVRDVLLGKQPVDYDIATSALPEEVLSLFSSFHCIETGIKHGTITVINQKHPIEITTFRKDSNYLDHRHPHTVTFVATLKQDIARRDFTINGLAYHPEEGFVDYCSGVYDLLMRVIRCIGNPHERFQEDALRILRAMRFASVLSFKIESDTSKAILEESNLLEYIAQERITHEFNRLLMGKKAVSILNEYACILKYVIKKELSCFLLPEDLFKEEDELWLRLLLFFHFSKQSVESVNDILKKMKYPKDIIKQVLSILKRKEYSYRDPYSLTYLIAETDISYVRQLLLFQYRSNILESEEYQKLLQQVNEIEKKKICCSIKDLAINGHDILSIERIQKEKVKDILQDCLYCVIENKLENKKEILMDYIKSRY